MKIKYFPLLAMTTLFLGACMSGSSDSGTTEAPRVNYTAPTTNTNTNTMPPRTTAPSVVTPPASSNANNASVLRLSMHYSLLLGQAHLYNESGGVKGISLSQNASAGASSIKVYSTNGLVKQQLITYRGRNGQYYTAQIQSIQNKTLRLATPLKQAVAAGGNAWNFYNDGSHPNWVGSFAIADFAVRRLGYNRLNQGKHVLLGDSWFSQNSVFERLKNRLPRASISNKGNGGNTSKNLLSRFDADVRWQNPNYVWIMTGTNDYWQSINTATYKSNMRQLINKVRSIGATPIVFDSSVGPLNYGSDVKTRLSRTYVTAMDQLISEY